MEFNAMENVPPLWGSFNAGAHPRAHARGYSLPALRACGQDWRKVGLWPDWKYPMTGSLEEAAENWPDRMVGISGLGSDERQRRGTHDNTPESASILKRGHYKQVPF